MFLTGDAKATFDQALLNTSIYTVDNLNKVLMEMTKHKFLTYAFHEQKQNYIGTQFYLRARSSMISSADLKSWTPTQGNFSWYTKTRNRAPFHGWDNGYNLLFYAHHIKNQNDWTCFQLHGLVCQRREWFLWGKSRKLRTKRRQEKVIYVFLEKEQGEEYQQEQEAR